MSRLVYKISQVKDGNMEFKYGEKEEVLKNRNAFFRQIGLKSEEIVFIRTRMKDDIVIATPSMKGNGSMDLEEATPCDALITTELDLGLFLDIGDCLPILIHDPIKEVLALVHSGWPNTDLRIAKKVIEKMVKDYNCEIANFEIVIGPGIQKESLIYDKNIFNLIKSDWGEFISVDEKDSEKYHIDNLGFTIKQLKDLSIKEEQLTIDKTDTFKDKRYFSHVRDYILKQKDEGRFCVVAKMTKPVI